MTSQRLEAGANATAVQATGNVTINQGVGAEGLAEIMSALAQQMPAYVAVAHEVAEKRVRELQQWVIERFAQPGANAEAFKEPDLQYLFLKSQQGYARSGAEELGKTLVDLIAERSVQQHRTRLALALNAAIEVASDLTPDEFAELSLVFLLRYTRNTTINDLVSFATFFTGKLTKLVPLVSLEISSYQYLEAKQCAIMEVLEMKLDLLWRRNYTGLFQSGFSMQEIEGLLDLETIQRLRGNNLIITCLHDETALQFGVIDGVLLRQMLSSLDIGEDLQSRLVSELFDAKCFAAEQLAAKLAELIPCYKDLQQVWDTSPGLKNVKLTLTGIALGHSNLKRVTDWSGDLSVWIK